MKYSSIKSIVLQRSAYYITDFFLDGRGSKGTTGNHTQRPTLAQQQSFWHRSKLISLGPTLRLPLSPQTWLNWDPKQISAKAAGSTLTARCSSWAAGREEPQSLSAHHQAADGWPRSSWHSDGSSSLLERPGHACVLGSATPCHTSTWSQASDLKWGHRERVRHGLRETQAAPLLVQSIILSVPNRLMSVFILFTFTWHLTLCLSSTSCWR